MIDERPRQTYEEMMSEKEAEREKKERQWEERRRLMLRNHAITGGVTFLILGILCGFPGSLVPLNLLGIVVYSAIVGMPIGFLVSWMRGGPYLGGLFSSLGFAVTFYIALLVGGSSLNILGIRTFLITALFASIPGIFIGLHVEQDQRS